MTSVGIEAVQPIAQKRDPQVWQMARNLQTTLFVDMLRNGGLADALSTGSDTLDHWNNEVIEMIAIDLAERDPAIADRLYNQLTADSERGPKYTEQI